MRKLLGTLLLLLSLMLAIVSAWSLSTFLRLSRSAGNYPDDAEFEAECQLTKKYVDVGKAVAIILVIVSITLVLFSSVYLWKSF